MPAQPAAATVRSPAWVAAAVALLAAFAFLYFPMLRYSAGKWAEPEYSHGFLVPLFSAYVAWRWRAWAPKLVTWPDPRGVGLLAVGAAIFVGAGVSNFAKEWLQGLSLVINLGGAVLLLGGPKALRWLWPSLAFLLFMFPLPYKVEHALGWQLQNVAARASTFCLQTLGFPSYQEGFVIYCAGNTLGVDRACSGLSMLLTFLALAVAVAMLVERPWIDRGLLLVSAVPIAVVANVARITVTGILYAEVGPETGEKVFHDLAGWLMMPFALGVFWLELKVLDWVFQEDLKQASREDVIKMHTSGPAHLFMANLLPGNQTGTNPPRPNPVPTNPPRGPGR